MTDLPLSLREGESKTGSILRQCVTIIPETKRDSHQLEDEKVDQRSHAQKPLWFTRGG